MAGRRGSQREWPWKGEAGNLGGWLGAEESRSRLVVLHGDGGCDVYLKGSGERSAGGELKKNGLPQFFGYGVDEGVVSPPRR